VEEKSTNNYNSIAHVYHFLSHLIFGKALLNAQFIHLNKLPKEGKVLFVGGGSGLCLKRVVEIRPNLNVIYLDQSAKMIELSKEKIKYLDHKVKFIVGNERNLPAGNYDAIITFFFLDVFNLRNLYYWFYYLHHSLVPDGIWLFADFNLPKNSFQKGLEKLMFTFLKLSTNIEAKKIYNFQSIFLSNQYNEESRKSFNQSFVYSSVFRKKKVE